MREQLDAGDVRRALDAALSPLLAQHSGEDMAVLATLAPLTVAVTARGDAGQRIVLGRYAADAPRLEAAVEAAVAGALAGQSDEGDLAMQAADNYAVRWDPERGDLDVFVVGATMELVHLGRVCDGPETLH